MSVSKSSDIIDEGKAACTVCANSCRLSEGETGRCRARTCRDGRIICSNYGMVTSLALDPIEKKPLARFMPGSIVLSVGSYGCNLRCPFCQNWEISMAAAGDVQTRYLTPEQLCSLAAELGPQGNIGIAYTYNEPLTGYEFVRDTAELIRGAGMKNVLVSNGSVSSMVTAEIIPLMDAMNIDLKGFSAECYEKVGGDFVQTRKFIEAAAASDTHLEVTTLIVPGISDSAELMEEEARWLASLDKDIPLHITRFFPRYKMEREKPTDIGLIHRLAETAGAYLDNVFIGNC